MAELNGSEILAKALKREGVEELFFLMGGPMLAAEAASINEGIRCIDVRHEQAAAMMAQAYSRLRQRPGVCMAASGPAWIVAGASADILVLNLPSSWAPRAGRKRRARIYLGDSGALLLGALLTAVAGLLALGLAYGFAFLVARSTVYTIPNRRVVLLVSRFLDNRHQPFEGDAQSGVDGMRQARSASGTVPAVGSTP